MPPVNIVPESENPFAGVLPISTYHDDELLRELVDKVYSYIARRNPNIRRVIEIGPGTNSEPMRAAMDRGWYHIGIDYPNRGFSYYGNRERSTADGDILEAVERSELSDLKESTDIILFWGSGVHAGKNGEIFTVYASIMEDLITKSLSTNRSLRTEDIDVEIYRLGRKLYADLKNWLSPGGCIVETNLGYAKNFNEPYFYLDNDISGSKLQAFVPYVSDMFSKVELMERSRASLQEAAKRRVEEWWKKGENAFLDHIYRGWILKKKDDGKIHGNYWKDYEFSSLDEALQTVVKIEKVTDAAIFWK